MKANDLKEMENQLGEVQEETLEFFRKNKEHVGFTVNEVAEFFHKTTSPVRKILIILVQKGFLKAITIPRRAGGGVAKMYYLPLPKNIKFFKEFLNEER